MEFIRFAGTINTHEEKKVVKATVNVVLEGQYLLYNRYHVSGR